MSCMLHVGAQLGVCTVQQLLQAPTHYALHRSKSSSSISHVDDGTEDQPHDPMRRLHHASVSHSLLLFSPNLVHIRLL